MFIFNIVVLQQIRQNDSKQEPLSAASEALVLERGAELVRISMMLQEASAICKGLNRPLVRGRAGVLVLWLICSYSIAIEVVFLMVLCVFSTRNPVYADL